MKAILLLALLLSQSVFADPVRALNGTDQSTDPTMIKLSDGRMVPFGPGIICSRECSSGEQIVDGESFLSRYKWPITFGLIGAAVGGILLTKNGDTPTLSPKNTTTPLIPASGTIGTGSSSIPNPVPEPATMLLLGAGITILVSRRRRHA